VTWPSLERVARRSRQPGTRWVRKLAWLSIPVVVVGEAGHHLLERLGHAVAHHLFHVLFVGGAALAFGIFVVLDVRRYGRPTFSWRLRPRSDEGAPSP
jgi:hypothetical protein